MKILRLGPVTGEELKAKIPSRWPRWVNFILTCTSRFPDARTPSSTEAINASLDTRQTVKVTAAL